MKNSLNFFPKLVDPHDLPVSGRVPIFSKIHSRTVSSNEKLFFSERGMTMYYIVDTVQYIICIKYNVICTYIPVLR